MELGDLPSPRIRASTTTTNTKRRTKETRSDWETISEFIEKYNIDAKNPKNDHNSLLHQRRQEMILGARKIGCPVKQRIISPTYINSIAYSISVWRYSLLNFWFLSKNKSIVGVEVLELSLFRFGSFRFPTRRQVQLSVQFWLVVFLHLKCHYHEVHQYIVHQMHYQEVDC